jgi:hypothetical protein
MTVEFHLTLPTSGVQHSEIRECRVEESAPDRDQRLILEMVRWLQETTRYGMKLLDDAGKAEFYLILDSGYSESEVVSLEDDPDTQLLNWVVQHNGCGIQIVTTGKDMA